MGNGNALHYKSIKTYPLNSIQMKNLFNPLA